MDSKVSFLAFCNLCEHLNRLQKVEQKKQKLVGFIEEWRKEDSKSLYSFLRLLLPHMDSERENYGLKENRLADLYISALALPRDSQDAQSLRNWQQSRHKDFADALVEVLKKRLGEDESSNFNTKKSKLDATGTSLKEINEILDRLSLSHLADGRRDLFLKVTAKMTATEQKWLTRIILKGLRVGLPDNQVLKLIHPDAPAIFDVLMNLFEVVKIFQCSLDQYDRDTHLQVKLFSPFRPMLAEREEMNRAAEILAGPFLIEPKLDGERCQLHISISTGVFRYFSRQGNEYTYLYGRSKSEGSLTPKIVQESPFADDLDSVILDGEMVVYDPLIDKFLPFGTLKTSAGARYDESKINEPHPCLVVFDIVYWNGQSLLNWSLNERIKLLKERVLVNPIKGFFDIIERPLALGTRTEDISSALDVAIQDQVEGLILKDPQSLYIPAHRSSHWIKIKPEYVEGLCDDLDVVVIGAWYGRAGNIKEAYGKANEFLCGIWSDDKSHVMPFVKVGSGYNSHEWSLLNQRLEPILVKTARQPDLVELTGADRPDLMVTDPFKSVVIQIKGSQLVASGTYKTLGLTLRFPRFISLRLDRSADSSLKFSELMRLHQITAGTLAKQRELSLATAGTKRKQINRPKGKLAQAVERAINNNAFLQTDAQENSQIIPQSMNIEVMILNGSDEFDKFELEQKVIVLGGKIVQSPPLNSDFSAQFIAIAGKDCGMRIKNLRALKTIDIIDAQWIIECEKSDLKLQLPFKTKHFFYMTEGTKSEFDKKIDRKLIETNEELQEIFKEIKIKDEDFSSSHSVIKEICDEFILHGIELPKWSRGINQVIPLNYSVTSESMDDFEAELLKIKIQFEKLKIQYIRAKWI